ncbi:MAG: RNA recognition motif containing protein [Hyphomicrobiales bacterium]|nr:MAG: RNA recognition motif containing protein [Hyphomicrobiales bacterium]
MNISILNLHRNMDKDQLEKLFASYGKVESCEIILDKNTGKSKGFGFVTMNDEAEATKAILELHGKIISNQKIRVKISAAPSS